MRKLEELNIFNTHMPRNQPTPSEISYVENLIDAKLPSTYIDFLDFCNGGCFELNTYIDEYDEYGIDTIFHISSDHSSLSNVISRYEEISSNTPKKILPIAADGFGNLFCLDLTEPDKDKVLFWFHEYSNDDPFVLLTNSFEEFIDSLVKNPHRTSRI